MQKKEIINKIKKLINLMDLPYKEPISKDNIHELEKELNISYPKDYVEFLQLYGWLCVGEGHLGGNAGKKETLKQRKYFPNSFASNLLVVDDDGSGNYYCLVCGGEDDGKVIYWQHDIRNEYKYPNVPDEKKSDYWIESSNFWKWLLNKLIDEKKWRDEI